MSKFNASFYKKNKKDEVAAVRVALRHILMDDGRDPNPNGMGSTNGWMIPARECDAASMLDKLALAAVRAVYS